MSVLHANGGKESLPMSSVQRGMKILSLDAANKHTYSAVNNNTGLYWKKGALLLRTR